ncbi:MAG: hypothetical protein Q7T03_01470 [Deltaproteobacteria bacterium]|nr:hypothetical protein [Deltaproteobacteria bacterium]
MIKFFHCLMILILAASSSAFAEEGVSLCQVPQRMHPVVCASSGSFSFLCLNTPPGSVKEDFVILKGRLNLESSVLGQISVSTQEDYTRQLATLSLVDPLTENCWNQTLTPQKNFCLEEDGSFSIRVPLPALGGYTLLLQASRVQGESAQSTMRVSHVIVPTVMPDVLHFEPDISSPLPAGTTHLKVVVDLLAGCDAAKESCDFIGAGTGGVVVSVENKMAGPPLKSVDCETEGIQGGAGRFVIGIPVQAGQNNLSITVCNAATGFDKASCPTLHPMRVEVLGAVSKIEILSPFNDGPLLFDSKTTHEISLRFKIPGTIPQKECDQSVKVALNLEPQQPVCPDADGVYSLLLHPEEGYNIAEIEANISGQKLIETVSFGFGKPLSPFNARGEVQPEEQWQLSKAVRVWLSAKMINMSLLPRINQYLSSADFREWIGKMTEEMGRGTAPQNAEPSASAQNVLKELPYCQSDSGTGALRIKVMESPQIGKLVLDPLEFSQNRLSLSARAEEVSLAIQLYRDDNGDGVPDIDPLPLKIAFKNLRLKPILEASSDKMWRLTSPYTDCDYKRKGACSNMPALFVPSQFEGNAGEAGAFVVCDRSQKVSSKMDEICHALNVVDRQTGGGAFQEKILDALNSAYACGGTTAITEAFRQGFDIEKTFDPWFTLKGSLGVDQTQIDNDGAFVLFNTRFGKKEDLARWAPDLRTRGAGILAANDTASTMITSSHQDGFSFGLSLPVLSQIFWGAQKPDGSNLSITIDEDFFKARGFDFDIDCQISEKEKKEPSPLCAVRPRAKEILGNMISELGYLQATDPVQLTLTPSNAFPLRVSAIDNEGSVQLEFADWELNISSGGKNIVTGKLSFQLMALISPPSLNATDPDSFAFTVKLVQDKSRWWILEKQGSNTTVIPGSQLLYNLEQGLKLAISYFATEGHEIKFSIPRSVFVPSGSLFEKLGMQELTWTPGGFNLGWDAPTNSLLFQGTPTTLH